MAAQTDKYEFREVMEYGGELTVVHTRYRYGNGRVINVYDVTIRVATEDGNCVSITTGRLSEEAATNLAVFLTNQRR